MCLWWCGLLVFLYTKHFPYRPKVSLWSHMTRAFFFQMFTVSSHICATNQCNIWMHILFVTFNDGLLLVNLPQLPDLWSTQHIVVMFTDCELWISAAPPKFLWSASGMLPLPSHSDWLSELVLVGVKLCSGLSFFGWLIKLTSA